LKQKVYNQLKMKKLFICFFLILTTFLNAQKIFKGFGFFGSLTQSAHYYKNFDTDKKNNDSAFKYFPEYFYPQSHISKEFFNWGAGCFLELGKEKLRWQTELEHANKGANEMEVTEPISGERSGSYIPNKYTYIQFNNYAKFYRKIGNANWYFMPGLRLEYLFQTSISVFTPFSADFPKFWFSGDLALGYEFKLIKNISAFVEYHWNPDIIAHNHTNKSTITSIRNRTLETRFGLVFRKKKRKIDDCNSPIYKGPTY